MESMHRGQTTDKLDATTDIQESVLQEMHGILGEKRENPAGNGYNVVDWKTNKMAQ